MAKTIGDKTLLKLPHWAVLAKAVRDNADASVKQFYDVLNSGSRFLIKRQLGEYCALDCIVAVITAVRYWGRMRNCAVAMAP